MPRHWVVFWVLLSFQSPVVPAATGDKTYGDIPLHFEENRGQAIPSVQFLSRGLGYLLLLETGKATVVLNKGTEKTATTRSIEMKLLGTRSSSLRGEERLAAWVNSQLLFSACGRALALAHKLLVLLLP